MKKARKILVVMILSVMGLCLLLVVASALSNLGMPQRSAAVLTLSEYDKIRMAETLHLRQTIGNNVWQSWGAANIPAITYNESYVFLVGYPDPPDGWIKVPAGDQRGGPWEVVQGDTFNGQPYYRQALPDSDVTPENFAVLVGERWAYSLQTRDWAKIRLAQIIQQDLPPILRPIFPYRLFVGQALSNDDKYISLSAHEAFHAWQGMSAPEKLATAENINREFESQYPWDDTSLQADWQAELDILADALRTTDSALTLELVRQFLALRASRRASVDLAPELIAYEQQREWLEGLARYAELEIWRLAYTGNYTPLPDTSMLAEFDDYTGFESRWLQEIQQMRRMAGDEGDGRFYYTGMAQAYLLDQLMPEWKTSAFDEDVWLEDLLEGAVKGQK